MLLNKSRLIRLDDPLRQTRIITRSPQQYKRLQLEDVSVEENVVYHLNQSYFDVPKHSIPNNGNIINLFRQVVKDSVYMLQHIYAEIAGLDMSYD